MPLHILKFSDDMHPDDRLVKAWKYLLNSPKYTNQCDHWSVITDQIDHYA